MKNGQNTDLNHKNVEFVGPQKSQRRAENVFTKAATNFYVQAYQDITLNTDLGRIRV